MPKLFLIILLLFSGHVIKAQRPITRSKYVLYTGLVLTSDSLRPIPFVAVRHCKRGLVAYTDPYGHFAIAVRQGDTIYFEDIETKSNMHIIPDTLQFPKYYTVKLMVRDTISLPTVYIHAMPMRSLFDNVIVKSDIPADEFTPARKNLEAEELNEAMKLKPTDAQFSQMVLAQTRASNLYYYKQAPPNNYFNPFAWAQFIQTLKRGDFKKKPAKKITIE